EFVEGEGPCLYKIESEKDIATLKFDAEKVSPVYRTLDLVKKDLPDTTTLIGFCGAPWTVAAYMLDGNSNKGLAAAREWVKSKPVRLEKLISVLVDASENYLSAQIEAGAEALQIFDSWAGLLKGEDFRRWVIKPTKALVARLKQKYPHVPVIGFPREAGE